MYKGERKKTYISNGYEVVQLKVEGKYKNFYIHRMVAQSFIDNPEDKPQVNHIDDNKTNNNICNLEWVTPKENMNYGTRTERAAAGIRGKKKGSYNNDGSPRKNIKTPYVRKKAVIAIDLVTGHREYFEKAVYAERELGVHRSAISNTLTGRISEAKGYTFEYANKKDQ